MSNQMYHSKKDSAEFKQKIDSLKKSTSYDDHGQYDGYIKYPGNSFGGKAKCMKNNK